MAYEALKVIRPFVKASSHFAPRLTGNLAFRAFCRPPRAGNLDAAQRQLTERAEARLSGAELRRVAFPGGEVQVYQFRTRGTQRKGNILLIHGWTGRAAFMTAFVEPLLAEGFDVLAIDLPGHGRSAGRTLHIPLAIAALHAVHTAIGPWHGIVAHSFGGAVATALVSGAVAYHPSIPVDRLVLIATPHSMPDIFAWFGQSVGLSRKSQYWLDANVLRLAGRELSTFEGPDLLRQAGVRTLVLHAPDDKEAPFAGAERMAEAGDHVTLVSLPGLGHRRILYARQSIEAVRDFMAS